MSNRSSDDYPSQELGRAAGLCMAMQRKLQKLRFGSLAGQRQAFLLSQTTKFSRIAMPALPRRPVSNIQRGLLA
jgi:hypothetical protein